MDQGFIESAREIGVVAGMARLHSETMGAGNARAPSIEGEISRLTWPRALWR